MGYDNTHLFSSRLARRPSSSCLDAQAARLETARYRLCSGRHRKCRQSMGSSRSHRGRRIPSPGASSWRSIQATAIPTISLARNAAYGRRKLRFPRALARHFLGISYHPGHMSRLLRRWGWSVQKPVRQAQQRDEEVIAQWPDQTWPQLKKKLWSKSEPSSV